MVVFAPRRFGKSSLVWRAAGALATEGVLVAQVDLMTTPSKESLAAALARSIYEQIASTIERVRERALAPFRGLQVQPTTAELGGARRHRVAVVMDEFQEVVSIDPDLPKLLRSVFQRQPEIAHVYLGSKQHVMERIFSDANEPFWRSAKSIELGPIPAAPFADFIAERFRVDGREVEPGVVAELLARTGCNALRLCERRNALQGTTPRRSGAAGRSAAGARAPTSSTRRRGASGRGRGGRGRSSRRSSRRRPSRSRSA